MAVKLLLPAVALFCGWNCLCKDFAKQSDGRIVEYRIVGRKATFTQVRDMAVGSRFWALHNVACGKADPIEKHRIFSGTVADYNVGTPRQGIPIFIAVDDKSPVLVAISDKDGKFSFRIFEEGDDSVKKSSFMLPKEFKDAYLYVGLIPALGIPRVEVPPIGGTLPSGSWTSQYPINDILKQNS